MPSSLSPGQAPGRSEKNAGLVVARKALLVVNPNSRKGGEANLRAVIEMLQDAGYEVALQESKSPAACAEELEQRCEEADLIMVAGGDGTISSVAETLYRHHKPLAILPLGTANDLARSLSIPHDLLTAGQLVVDDKLREIDLGVVNGHYFFNAVNIGLGTEITHHLSRDVKKLWGVFSYLKAVWSTLSRKHAFTVDITVDGHHYRHRSIHLTVGNGRYYGGGNVVNEAAEIDSGKLFLYSIRPQTVWKLIVLAPLLRLGKQKLASRTFSAAGEQIEIRTPTPLEIHADGELVDTTPAKLHIIPQAIAVYAPPARQSPLAALGDRMHS